MQTELHDVAVLDEIEEFHSIFLEFKDKAFNQEVYSKELYAVLEKFYNLFWGKLFSLHVQNLNCQLENLKSQIDELVRKSEIQ